MNKTSIFTKSRRISWAPRLVGGLLLFVCCCDVSQRAFAQRIEAGLRQLSVYPEYTASFDADFNPIEVDMSDPATNDPSYIHQIDIFAEISGLSANEDLAGIGFDIELGPGLSIPEDLQGWKANRPGVPNDFSELARMGIDEIPQWFFDGDYFTNTDAGPNGRDLYGILLLIGPRTAMMGQFGETDGQRLKLGTIYVQWDGLAESSIQTAFPLDEWLLWTKNENGDGDLNTLLGALYSHSPETTVTFGNSNIIQSPSASPVPEPSTLMLSVLGLTLSLTRRRRSQRPTTPIF